MDTPTATLLTTYLQRLDGAPIDPAAAAFFASLLSAAQIAKLCGGVWGGEAAPHPTKVMIF
ncbi:MAG TPA: hypothetical protein VKE41_22120 [Roseiflexaceae bacterium]|nr:hypothetical protein [Roseiflexaceae bacterium]